MDDSQPRPLPAPAGVAILTGLLTQIIAAVTQAAGADQFVVADSAGLALGCSLRDRHLHRLAELTEPGGTAILISKVVSSDTAPEICHTDCAEELQASLENCLAAGIFFGLHPEILFSELTTDTVATSFEAVQISPPWLWKFAAGTCAVVAFTACRNDL